LRSRRTIGNPSRRDGSQKGRKVPGFTHASKCREVLKGKSRTPCLHRETAAYRWLQGGRSDPRCSSDTRPPMPRNPTGSQPALRGEVRYRCVGRWALARAPRVLVEDRLETTALR